MEKESKIMLSKVDGGQKKIHVVAYCDSPTCATGFGTVSRNIFEGLYKTGRYHIDILGINYWGDPHNFPYRIWPTATNPERDPYGRRKVANMITQMKYDLLFFLQDSFILEFLPELHDFLARQGRKFKSICYYPIDGVPKEQWIKNVCSCDYVYTYSQFGKKQSETVWPDAKNKNIGVVPHGVNVNDYYPLPKDQVDSFRKQYFGSQADKFIFMNLNRNQIRKDIPRSIRAFVEFRKYVPDSVLYLHMMKEDQGWNLPEVCKFFGLDITKDVIFPENFGANQGYPRPVVNLLYNAVDCVISTAVGEGWGLCVHPNTCIYTEKGIREIGKITINDKVLSSDGTYNEVQGIMTRNYSGDLYEITTWLSNIPIKSSPEHGFMVFENNTTCWKKAEDLRVGDNLLFPKNYSQENTKLNVFDIVKSGLNIRRRKSIEETDTHFRIVSAFKPKDAIFIPKEIEITPSLMRLFGLYLAGGSISSSKLDAVTFSFNKDETDLISFVSDEIKKVFGLNVVYEDHLNKGAYNRQSIKFYSSIVAILFSILFGFGSRNKKIHSILLNQNKLNLKELLLGEFLGNGRTEEKQMVFSTTSMDLAYSIRLLLARLEILSSVKTSRAEYKITISGASKDMLLKLFGQDIPVLNRKHVHEKCSQNHNYLLLPIKSINKVPYEGKLIDIQVKNTNNFVAENVIVHNSWVEAMATKTPVIMPGNTAITEHITEDKGFIVKSGGDPNLYTVLPHDNEVPRPLTDINDMVRKMLFVYNNYDEALKRAENAYKWVTTELNWQGPIAKRWVEIFDNAYRELETRPNLTKTTAEKLQIQAEQF